MLNCWVSASSRASHTENSELEATPTVQFRLLGLRDIVPLTVEGEDGQGRILPLQSHLMAVDRLQKVCPESGSRSGSFGDVSHVPGWRC
jgi:hypothetical protein